MTASPSEHLDDGAITPLTERRWFRPVVLVVILVVCAWAIWGIAGRIDWGAVWDALGRLAFWQFPVLIAVLLLRQLLNALPLAFFIRGLSPFRALINDLTAAMISMIAPPPSDMVMRVTMFKSWGIEASRGLAGATMNTVSFYVNRFAAPIIGLALMAFFGFETNHTLVAIAAGLFSITLAVLAYSVVRTEGFAERFGRRSGVVAKRFRSSVDPEEWAAFTSDFRSHIADTYNPGFWRSLVVLAAMVFAEAIIVLMSMRFVGVDASEIPAEYIIAVFFLAYPLTLFPLSGLGILDTVLLAAFLGYGGDEIEAEVVAAFAVWRVVTLLVPPLLGIGAVSWWRRDQTKSSADASA